MAAFIFALMEPNARICGVESICKATQAHAGSVTAAEKKIGVAEQTINEAALESSGRVNGRASTLTKALAKKALRDDKASFQETFLKGGRV